MRGVAGRVLAVGLLSSCDRRDDPRVDGDSQSVGSPPGEWVHEGEAPATTDAARVDSVTAPVERERAQEARCTDAQRRSGACGQGDRDP